jgi:C4-dicarboxylate transporter, DctM subunit
MTLTLSLIATGLFILGVPIFLVIGLWVVAMSFVVDLSLSNVGFAFSAVFTTSFALLAMPLFILTGDLINRSGIAYRLSAFAYACMGWLRGGLGMASIGACGLFRRDLGVELGHDRHHRGDDASAHGQERLRRTLRGGDGRGGRDGRDHHPAVDHLHRLRLPDEPLDLRSCSSPGSFPALLMVIAMQAGLLVRLLDERLGAPDPVPVRTRMIKTAFGAWLGFFAIGLVLWGIYTGQVLAHRGGGRDGGLLHHRGAGLAAALPA